MPAHSYVRVCMPARFGCFETYARPISWWINQWLLEWVLVLHPSRNDLSVGYNMESINKAINIVSGLVSSSV